MKLKPEFYKNDLNKEEYQKFIKFYKKEFSKVTSYNGEDRYHSNLKNIKIKFFDLIESDFAARDKIFSMKTWDDSRYLIHYLRKILQTKTTHH